jgi:hypothetical protein
MRHASKPSPRWRPTSATTPSTTLYGDASGCVASRSGAVLIKRQGKYCARPLRQYGILKPGGCEEISHNVSTLINADTNMQVVALDVRNAFNSPERSGIAKALHDDPKWNFGSTVELLRARVRRASGMLVAKLVKHEVFFDRIGKLHPYIARYPHQYP